MNADKKMGIGIVIATVGVAVATYANLSSTKDNRKDKLVISGVCISIAGLIFLNVVSRKY